MLPRVHHFLISVILGLSLFSSAFAFNPSAYRNPREDWRKTAQKHFATLRELHATGTALSVAKPLSEIGSFHFVEYNKDLQSMNTLFTSVRDLRFLPDPSKQSFKRRISWMYPDDGCFMRAEWMERLIETKFQSAWINKVFVFGNLNVKTANSPSGSVSWWYHVVVGMSVGGNVFVFDPAIEPSRPLPLKQWLGTMTTDVSSLKIAVCKHSTYTPSEACDTEAPASDSELSSHVSSYLSAERSRLLELKRDADKQLGDSPPWLSFHQRIHH